LKIWLYITNLESLGSFFLQNFKLILHNFYIINRLAKKAEIIRKLKFQKKHWNCKSSAKSGL